MEDLLFITQSTQASGGEDAQTSALFDSIVDPGLEDFGFDSDE
jgi:hypothetical protein